MVNVYLIFLNFRFCIMTFVFINLFLQMYFHFGVDTIILFKEWTTSSTQGNSFQLYENLCNYSFVKFLALYFILLLTQLEQFDISGL